jgi:hypothetical protein
MDTCQVDRVIGCVVSWEKAQHLEEDLVAFCETTKETVCKWGYISWVSKNISQWSGDVLQVVFRLSPYDIKVTTEQFSLACQESSVEVVELILREGEFDVNLGSKDTLPLIRAIKGNKMPVIAALLDAGADINREVPLGKGFEYAEGALLLKSGKYTKCAPGAPLQVALQYEYRNVEVIEYLLRRGATFETWPWDKHMYEVVKKAAFRAGIYTLKKNTQNRSPFR